MPVSKKRKPKKQVARPQRQRAEPAEKSDEQEQIEDFGRLLTQADTEEAFSIVVKSCRVRNTFDETGESTFGNMLSGFLKFRQETCFDAADIANMQAPIADWGFGLDSLQVENVSFSDIDLITFTILLSMPSLLTQAVSYRPLFLSYPAKAHFEDSREVLWHTKAEKAIHTLGMIYKIVQASSDDIEKRLDNLNQMCAALLAFPEARKAVVLPGKPLFQSSEGDPMKAAKYSGLSEAVRLLNEYSAKEVRDDLASVVREPDEPAISGTKPSKGL
jgi:hypothetical protein